MPRLKWKSLLFFGLIAFLFLPLSQMLFNWKSTAPLQGAIEVHEYVELNPKSWFSAQFQDGFGAYYNHHFGFRPEMIRLKNQWDYSLFNTLNARGIVMGNDGVLFDKAYLEAYNGLDYVGADSIRKVVAQLKELQSLLEVHDRTLLVCFAPSKAYYFKDYFPENFPRKDGAATNYKIYLRELAAAQVNYFDFNQWFLEMKDSCNCPLMVKNGIHWSQYGALLAANKMLGAVEKFSPYHLPEMVFDSIERTSIPRFTDNDISKTLNLQYPLPSEENCYPHYRWLNTDSCDRPKALVIGDSFYWNLFNIGLGRDIFQYGGFWYYNREIYPDSYTKPAHAKHMDVTQKLIENDVYILIVSEPNLTDFPWGFLENAIEVFSNYSDSDIAP